MNQARTYNMEIYEDDPGIDPKNYNFEELQKIYEGYTPVGWGIVVRVFKPLKRNKTAGGVILPDSTLSELQQREKFYTFTGLVIKLAQGVYQDLDKYSLTGSYCKPGDWIHFSRSEGRSFAWRGLTSVQIQEDRVLGVVDKPEDLAALSSQLFF